MKSTYQAPLTEQLVINFEEGILVLSNKAKASAMSQNDELFDEWDY